MLSVALALALMRAKESSVVRSALAYLETTLPAQFTLYHDGQFWCGVYETSSNNQLRAVRVVFGPEPNNAELYEWLLVNGSSLVKRAHRSVPIPGTIEEPQRGNPKRLQRKVNKEQRKTSGVSSKAQEATKLNFELANANKKKASRIARREEAQRKFQIRAMKKKAKHKGK